MSLLDMPSLRPTEKVKKIQVIRNDQLRLVGRNMYRHILFEPFHYTALGHLHQAHYVLNEKIRYAGSPLKYSISEEHHNKGFFIVELDEEGQVTVEKRELKPETRHADSRRNNR